MRVIAIDGPAGSGKSTVARALAARLGLDYLDTGAMYRSVAFAALRGDVDPERRRSGGRAWSPTSTSRWRTGSCSSTGSTPPSRSAVPRSPGRCRPSPPTRRCVPSWSAASGSGPSARGGGVIEGRDIGIGGVPRRHPQGVPHRPRRRPGPAAGPRRSPTSTTRPSPPTSPGATPSTRGGRPARSTEADDAVVIDTTDRTIDDDRRRGARHLEAAVR